MQVRPRRLEFTFEFGELWRVAEGCAAGHRLGLRCRDKADEQQRLAFVQYRLGLNGDLFGTAFDGGVRHVAPGAIDRRAELGTQAGPHGREQIVRRVAGCQAEIAICGTKGEHAFIGLVDQHGGRGVAGQHEPAPEVGERQLAGGRSHA